MTQQTPPPSCGLEALDDGRAWRPRDHGDRLVLRGGDVEDLLHRISASELRHLGSQELRPALFTDDKGRVIDLAQLGRRGDEWELWCGPGRGRSLREWIERWIIVEDVHVEVSTSGFLAELFGPATLGPYDRLDVSPGRWADADGVRVLWPRAPRGSGLLLRAEHASRVQPTLDAFLPIDPEHHRLWRVTRARVLPGPALEARPNPLELGWKALVSFSKGCYIGQEVVARLDTYEKVRRRVVQLKGEGRVPETGEELRHEGKKRGEVLEAAPCEEAVWVLGLLSVDHEVDRGVEWNGGAGTISTVPAPEDGRTAAG